MASTDDALARLRSAANETPSDPYARVALAEMLGSTGLIHEALSQLAIATSLATDPIAADSVATCLARTTEIFRQSWRLPDDADAVREFHGDDPAESAAPAPTAFELAEFAVSDVSLGDVAGLADVKRHLETRVLAPVREPELAERYGQSATGGVLLWGPPGCGKTLVARALAGTLSLSFGAASVADLLDMWIGSSERNVAALFTEARAHAPCVVFLDETDAIGHRRGSSSGANVTQRNVVSQLLVEMDGIGGKNEGVFVVGATNAPWDIDAALRRPGRFDRAIFVPPPDHDARVAILSAALVRAPLADLKLDKIARQLRGHSGADVHLVATTAIDLAYDQARATGAEVPVTMAHLEAATARTSPSIDEWVEVARIAADASDDAGIFEQFNEWYRTRSRRGR